MLLALPVDMAARNPDPVMRGISTVREVREQFTAALEVLDEVDRDKSAILAAGKAADRDTQARRALVETRSATPEGLHALIRHYAEDIGILELRIAGAQALQALASALPPASAGKPPALSLASRFVAILGETVILAMLTGGVAAASKLPHLI
jgi:hypothetical protein